MTADVAGPGDEPSVLVEQHDRVRVLTLNRPKVHNALSVDLAERVASAVESAASDQRTRVVVIRAAGRSFSAGYDLGTGSYGSRTLEDNTAHLRGLAARWERVLHCDIPVIAEVHGHCLAGGTDLASHCDLVVVADDATIGVPPVRSMGVALTQMWLYTVGPQWAKRLLLTGDTISGRLAAELGFAVTSVPAAELHDEVMKLAGRIALVAREMLIGNKYVINYGLDLLGRPELQDVAAQQDALAHQSAAAEQFAAHIRENGLRAALRARDEPFGDSRLEATT